MKALEQKRNFRAADEGRVRDTVVEMTILLESRLLAALESAACEQGKTVGNMVRCLLRDVLSSTSDDRPAIPNSPSRNKRTGD